jgi:hypothetical protein
MHSTELYPNLKLSKSLSSHAETQRIVQETADRFLCLGGLDKLKNDGRLQDLTHEICLVIEQIIPTGNPQKLDKKEIVVEIVKKLFPDLGQLECAQLSKSIDFIVSLGLKKITRCKRFRRWLRNIFSCSSSRNHFLDRPTRGGR